MIAKSMSLHRLPRGRRFWIGLSVPLLALGCSVIASTDPEQCATDTDCYVKFGGGFTCQSGGCIAAPQVENKSHVVTTLDACRSTQECVATLGEGWLCRRNRDDPQRKGKCQQLTPTTDCRVYGEYKNDQAIMLGALIPGKESPELAKNVALGLTQAASEWEGTSRQLQQTNTGADAVAPPRPFAIVACSEDVPREDLRNLFLNSGVALVIGPSTLHAGSTSDLATELTTARLPLVSPTSLSVPTEGPNIATYFFRVASSEDAAITAFNAITPAPTVLIRRTGSYPKIAAAVKGRGGVTELTYDAPAAFAYTAPGGATPSVVILGDGEVATVIAKVPKDAQVFVLPTAMPDIMAQLKTAPASLPTSIKALRTAAGTVVPTPPFAAEAFGAAQTYDAVYASLIGVAAVGDAKSPELVREDALVTALRRVTAVDGTKTYQTAPTVLRDVLQELRTSAEAKLKLAGTSGEVTFSPEGQATPRTFSFCTVTADNCN